MSETLYRKSWEPLSEADKSEPQVVRSNLLGTVAIARYIKGQWTVNGSPLHPGILTCSFLCLTPVTPEDK